MTVERDGKLRRLGERSLGLGESPVDPLRQNLDVPGLNRRAAPDAKARGRIAVVREIVTGAFLLDGGGVLERRLGMPLLLHQPVLCTPAFSITGRSF